MTHCKIIKFLYKIVSIFLISVAVYVSFYFFVNDSFEILSFWKNEKCFQQDRFRITESFSQKISFIRNKQRSKFCKNGNNNTLNILPTNKFVESKTNHSDCSLDYVVMNFKGRLGNNVCQYLSLLLLKYLFDVRIAVHPNMYQLLSTKFENLEERILDTTDCHTRPLVNITYQDLFKDLHNKSLSGNRPQDSMKESYYVNTYPCPAQILILYREYLKTKLKLLNAVKLSARHRLKSVLSKSSNSEKGVTLVSVHVRRTDYFNHMTVLHQRGVLSSCYYKNALNYFRERFKNNVTFIVSSDDIRWCVANLESNDVVFTGGAAETDDPIFDFALLSLADYHVTGLGTFGFLSAFYGRGPIMFPLVDTDQPSEIEREYICSASNQFIPMLDEIVN